MTYLNLTWAAARDAGVNRWSVVGKDPRGFTATRMDVRLCPANADPADIARTTAQRLNGMPVEASTPARHLQPVPEGAHP